MSEPANPNDCPVCKTEAPWINKGGGGWGINCQRCGTFDIGWIAVEGLGAFSATQRANLSGWIRENQGCVIGSNDLKSLSQIKTPSVGEKAEKLLSSLSRKHSKPGEKIATELVLSLLQFNDNSNDRPRTLIKTPELLGISWSQDEYELQFLIDDYLIGERSFLSKTEEAYLRITPKGWAYLDLLRQGNPNSQIGFIAMWFDASMNTARIAIESGIREAGYKPFRVDQKEHNNDITDEIIAGIRGCRFLVADLTGHRNGVYYEAGFAKGLGLEVVWLCRKSDEKDRHFDIRQLSTIFWEEDKLPELSKALQKRIEASIGRGPLQPAKQSTSCS